jgi:hypothetical protein
MDFFTTVRATPKSGATRARGDLVKNRLSARAGLIAVASLVLFFGASRQASASPGCDRVNAGVFNIPAGDFTMRRSGIANFRRGDRITFEIVIEKSATGNASTWSLEQLLDDKELISATASGTQSYTIADSQHRDRDLIETLRNNVGVTATCKSPQ